jgi:hypothetical protein
LKGGGCQQEVDIELIFDKHGLNIWNELKWLIRKGPEEGVFVSDEI